MKTVTIGCWEFTHAAERLSYRQTIGGLVSGVLILLALAGVFVLIFFKQLRELSGAGQFFWCLGSILACAGCLFLLWHHLRSRAFPYSLDKRLDRFWNGSRKLCALSDIRSVDVLRIEGLEGPDQSKFKHFRIEFALQNGETVNAYLGHTSRERTEEYAAQLEEFLGF